MNSIRLRLLLALLALLVVAALVMGALTYRSVLGEAEALFDYQLRQMALSLRDQGEIPATPGPFSDEQLDFVVQIWTVDGRSIYASRQHSTLPARALLGLADITVDGNTWRTYGVATRDRVIQVAQPRQIRRRLAADAALRAVAPLLVIAPLLALGLWWMAALLFAPLRRLAAELRRRDDRSTQALPTAGLPDEVAPLVNSLNALLQRLGTSLELQRAFVSDAAHELRSPLTALKLQLQLLQRAPDDAARADAVAALGSGLERAARLVEQLLALARNEPGAPAAAPVEVDLTEIVRQALADSVPLARQRGSEIELQADAPVALRGDPVGLAVLARNLADNALRYSPPGARVVLRVGDDAGRPLLQVDDSGPGIPADERERVFDRFYRRASGETQGSGLGLAIVRSVAQLHGAAVELDSSPLGGLQVRVRFPGPTG